MLDIVICLGAFKIVLSENKVGFSISRRNTFLYMTENFTAIFFMKNFLIFIHN